jgi:drug/metabolite transporter (DMT)-like permease
MVMLAVQAGMFLAAIYAIVFQRGDRPDRRRPIWSSLAVSLVIVAATSYQIAEKHAGQPGADVIAYAAPLLLGMGITCALVLIRKRRGLDAAGP